MGSAEELAGAMLDAARARNNEPGDGQRACKKKHKHGGVALEAIFACDQEPGDCNGQGGIELVVVRGAG